MKLFSDSDGDAWVATVRSDEGLDFKGRHHLYFHPADAEDDGVELLDVRWNSHGSAERTLATMSQVELRRRLRSALGRAAKPPQSEEQPESEEAPESEEQPQSEEHPRSEEPPQAAQP